MFQKINDKINFSFETEIPKTTEDIMTSLKEKASRHKWYSFLIPGQVDYKEFKFLDNEIEIRRMAGPFWAFRPFGKIRFTFHETSRTMTKVRCEVMTGSNSVPFLMAIQTIVLLLWSAGWILLGWRLDLLTRYGVPIGVVLLASGISVFKILRDRRSLINHSDTIIKLIKE